MVNIAKAGSHNELLDTEQAYYKLCKIQSAKVNAI